MIQMRYMMLVLTDNIGWFERTLRSIAKAIGFNPWAIDLHETLIKASQHEDTPVSRYAWGSPCRFIRTIDVTVHVVLPAMIADTYPAWATYLRTTSPRWGRSWRHW